MVWPYNSIMNTIEKCYALGAEARKTTSSWREAMMTVDIPANADLGCLIAMQAGYLGQPMPYKVTGWRYGHIPACGQSRNFADDRLEPGISLMETDCGLKTQDGISGLFIAASGRPVVRVEGYLNTVATGSDGEPLVFWAKEI